LRALERLDVRLLVDREHQRALRRIKVEADDLGRLGDEVGIVADTPRLAAVEVDLLGPQEAPDVLVADIAQRLGHESAGPASVTLWRRPFQAGQDAAVRHLVVLGRGAAARPRLIRQAGQTRFRKADAPQAHGSRHGAKVAGNRPRRTPFRGHQHDPGPERIALLARRRPDTSLQLRPLFRRKPDLSRRSKHEP